METIIAKLKIIGRIKSPHFAMHVANIEHENTRQHISINDIMLMIKNGMPINTTNIFQLSLFIAIINI